MPENIREQITEGPRKLTNTCETHFWSWGTLVLSFTAMKHKPFRKPRIRKFGDVSRLTRQQPQGKEPSPQGLYDPL